MYGGDSPLRKKQGPAENAGDAVSESLIPIQSRTADAMSELAHSPEPLLPPLALVSYIACVAGSAALANCSVIAALLNASKNGLFVIIMQLAIADFALGASIAPELWSNNIRTWYFGLNGCIAYRGLNVLASTASTYLVTTIALHTLATANLEEKSITKRMRRNEHDEDEELGSSRHSLVASSNSSTPPRTMNIDYRVLSTKVPVTQPSIFIWVLSASISVPEFVLATTVDLDHDVVLCTIVDSSQRLYMYSVLVLFNLFLPTIIMCAVGTLVIIKLKSKKYFLQIDNCESKAALKLSIWLIIIHFVLCTPRSVVTAYNIYFTSMRYETSIYNETRHSEAMSTINFASSSIYICSTLIRPLLCIFLLSRVRKAFAFGFVKSDVENV